MAEGGFDPMRSEQDFENPMYDDDEYNTDTYTCTRPRGRPPGEQMYEPDDR